MEIGNFGVFVLHLTLLKEARTHIQTPHYEKLHVLDNHEKYQAFQ